jgi:hypothetical protein
VRDFARCERLLIVHGEKAEDAVGVRELPEFVLAQSLECVPVNRQTCRECTRRYTGSVETLMIDTIGLLNTDEIFSKPMSVLSILLCWIGRSVELRTDHPLEHDTQIRPNDSFFDREISRLLRHKNKIRE